MCGDGQEFTFRARSLHVFRPSPPSSIDHECDLDVYCSGCDKVLPWALYQIRELDDITLSEAPAAIAELLAELEGDSQIASA